MHSAKALAFAVTISHRWPNNYLLWLKVNATQCIPNSTGNRHAQLQSPKA
jgi:hypothetical protein